MRSMKTYPERQKTFLAVFTGTTASGVSSNDPLGGFSNITDGDSGSMNEHWVQSVALPSFLSERMYGISQILPCPRTILVGRNRDHLSPWLARKRWDQRRQRQRARPRPSKRHGAPRVVDGFLPGAGPLFAARANNVGHVLPRARSAAHGFRRCRIPSRFLEIAIALRWRPDHVCFSFNFRTLFRIRHLPASQQAPSRPSQPPFIGAGPGRGSGSKGWKIVACCRAFPPITEYPIPSGSSVLVSDHDRPRRQHLVHRSGAEASG